MIRKLNEYKNLAKNTLLFSLGTLGSTVISFFLVMIYTRYLTTSEYGMIDLINTTISLVVPVITLQITEAVFRFVMDEAIDKQKLISTAIYFVCISTFLFFITTIYFGRKYMPKEVVSLFYLLVVINAIIRVQTAFVKGLKRIKTLVTADILSSIFMAIMILIFLVKLQVGITGYFIAIIISWIFKSSILCFKERMYNYLISPFDKNLLKQMLRYSVFLIPNAIIWWVVNVSDRYLLAYFLGVEAVGIYAVSYKIPQLLSIPTMIFYQAWQISAVESYKSENRDQVYTNVFTVYLALLMISLSIFLPLLKPLTSILFSSSFYESWKYASFLLFGTVFSALSSFSGTVYIASKESKGALLTSSIAALINAGVNIILIPVWGIYAASFSTFLAYFIMWVARMQHIKRFANVRLNLKKFIVSFFITVLQMLTLYVSLSRFELFAIHTTALVLILVIFRREVINLIKIGTDLGREVIKFRVYTK
ncbi:MAG: hypothetical protein PWP39_1607 [Pyrococcus sp.]|uniref:lipopolysaccharide biosynthesis protein n=1 Tax=Pyrococcus sp. TaxID=33866 RepID=UPI00258FB6D8|nr:oligosaccharide flippase family protein [Pyrococcus sp.]MDK2870372.1 hypothetical protein [Pyrococcus sp.]